ncbi:cytochrome oxidase small assembly protein [Ramlibacter sp.]|nr:cytochrome oxidase small assembly protein [Ramlibacter sp.]MDB5954551.1 hypothetical protein [Ramlibacter sp.]
MADDTESSSAQARKKSNLRLALILASIALVFFVGFLAKMVFLRH